MSAVISASKMEEFISSIKNSNSPITDELENLRTPFVNRLLDENFPTTRDEYWKYIRTNKIAKSSYSFLNEEVSNTISSAFVLDEENKEIDAYKVVLKNGFNTAHDYNNLPNQSIANIKEITACFSTELADYFAKEEDNDRNVFNTLNSAYFNGGFLIELNETLDKPLHIIHEISGGDVIAQPRIIVTSKKSVEATIIHTTVSDKANNVLLNGTYEIFVAENSNISVINIQNEREGVFQVNNTQAHQEKNSTVSLHFYSLNGDWIRNNTNILVNGEGCESNLYGAYTAINKQQIDNHTVVDHRKANCESNELYKGTATDKATVTFNGKVFVRQDAQKINAFQSNNNILLSDDATINSKPELEIYADDVKCSHGSTTGQLDEEALFYLRSRGLSPESANKLLVGAFVGEVIENVKQDVVKHHIAQLFGLE